MAQPISVPGITPHRHLLAAAAVLHDNARYCSQRARLRSSSSPGKMSAESEEYLGVLKASYDYDPQSEDEIEIKEDQLLLLIERTDEEYVHVLFFLFSPFFFPFVSLFLSMYNIIVRMTLHGPETCSHRHRAGLGLAVHCPCSSFHEQQHRLMGGLVTTKLL